MLVRERRTSSANGAFGRHDRHDNAGMRLVTAASWCRSSARKSIALMVRQAGQRTMIETPILIVIVVLVIAAVVWWLYR